MSTDSIRSDITQKFELQCKPIISIAKTAIEGCSFASAREQLNDLLRAEGNRNFHAALNFTINDDRSEIQDCIYEMFDSINGQDANISEISGLGIDLSAHSIGLDEQGNQRVGAELNLYSKNAFDFGSYSIKEIERLARSGSTSWQGNFIEISTAILGGFQNVAHFLCQSFDVILMKDNGDGVSKTLYLNPDAISHTISLQIVNLEFHRFIHEQVRRLKLPNDMTVVVSQHDLNFISSKAYKAEKDSAWCNQAPTINSGEQGAQVTNGSSQTAEEMRLWMRQRTRANLTEVDRQKFDASWQQLNVLKKSTLDAKTLEPEAANLDARKITDTSDTKIRRRFQFGMKPNSDK